MKNREEYREIKGYENYEVSNLGNVRKLPHVSYYPNGFIGYTSGKDSKAHVTAQGYLRVILNGTNITVHQLVAIAFLGHTPNGVAYVVDHINNNPIDNRLENLQVISNRENCSKDKKGGSSKYVGVSKKGNSWVSQITINKDKVYLGAYKKEIDASKAYQLSLKHINLYNGDVSDFRKLIKYFLLSL